MLFNDDWFNFFIKEFFKMIRLFLVLFSFNLSSDILEREDIKEFIDMALENSDLEKKK